MLIVLVIILLLAIQWYIASQVREIAQAKGYTESRWFHICFWLGIIGVLLVIALPNKHMEAQQQRIIALLEQTLENGDSPSGKAPVEKSSVWMSEEMTKALEKSGDAKEQKVVYIDRSADRVACSACGTWQRSDRKICFNCGAVFAELAAKSE